MSAVSLASTSTHRAPWRLASRSDSSVFSGDDVPAWAAEAVTCLNSYGIDLLSQPGSPVTMQQAAHLLYQLHSLMQTEQLSASLLGWAADA